MFDWSKSNVKMSLYNVDIGEKLMDADSFKDVKLDVNTKYETRYDVKDHDIASQLKTNDRSLSFNCDKTDVDFDKIFGIGMAAKPDAYDITYFSVVQCRRHKKKRINKKWAKRYGYKPIIVKTKGWQINTYADGTFEFKKDIK